MSASLGRRLRRGRKWLRRLAFSLLPLTLLVVGIEVAVRVAGQGHPGAGVTVDALQMAPHTTRIWSLSPGTLTMDGVVHTIGANTLRVVEPRGAPLRALTLGDSSIFGHGLEDQDTLHAQLSEVLSAQGVAIDIFCGGVSGYSTEQSLVLLDEVGWDLEPDLLVIGNLWSDASQDNFVDREWLSELNRPGRRLGRLLSRSAAWRRLRQRPSPGTGPQAGLPVGWVQEPYSTRGQHHRVPLKEYAENLDRMLLAAAERGVSAIFLAPCNRYRLESGGVAGFWEPYFEGMEVVAKRRGVPVVQARDVLRAEGLSDDAAFLDELHPTAASNHAYAEALADALLQRGWPEERLVPDPAPPLVTLEGAQ